MRSDTLSTNFLTLWYVVRAYAPVSSSRGGGSGRADGRHSENVTPPNQAPREVLQCSTLWEAAVEFVLLFLPCQFRTRGNCLLITLIEGLLIDDVIIVPTESWSWQVSCLKKQVLNGGDVKFENINMSMLLCLETTLERAQGSRPVLIPILNASTWIPIKPWIFVRSSSLGSLSNIPGKRTQLCLEGSIWIEQVCLACLVMPSF